MTTPDFHALCAELVHELDNTQKSLMYHQGCSAILDSVRCALIDRARAALAEPEPEGPTDEELHQLWLELFAFDEGVSSGDVEQIARAVLARWGR